MSFFRPFYIAANKEYLTERQIIFKCINSTFLQVFCLKFSLKLPNISISCEENKTVPFYHLVIVVVVVSRVCCDVFIDVSRVYCDVPVVVL